MCFFELNLKYLSVYDPFVLKSEKLALDTIINEYTKLINIS